MEYTFHMDKVSPKCLIRQYNLQDFLQSEPRNLRAQVMYLYNKTKVFFTLTLSDSEKLLRISK